MQNGNPPDLEYVLGLYAEASGSWDTFRRSTEAADLRAVARVLCAAVQALQMDERFWQKLYLVTDLDERDRVDVMAQLHDVDEFFAQHYETLSNLRSGEFAIRLLTDLNVAIDAVEEWPDRSAIEDLRRQAENLRVAVCNVTGFQDDGPGRLRGARFVQGVRIVAKGLLFTAGGALCVADILTVHGVVHVAPSVIKGTKAMISAL